MKIFNRVRQASGTNNLEQFQPSVSGQIVETKGFYFPNDGGGTKYLIQTDGEYGGTPDGYIDIQLSNAHVAKQILDNGIVDVKKAGAKGDAVTDDSAVFAACAAITTGSIHVPKGTYNVPTGDFSGSQFHTLDVVTIDNNPSITVTHLITDGGSGGGGGPLQVAMYYKGILGATITLMTYSAIADKTFPQHFVNSQAWAENVPAANASLPVQKNGVNVGTVEFAAGQPQGGFVLASPLALVAGDRLTIKAPDTGDSTLGNISVTLVAE